MVGIRWPASTLSFGYQCNTVRGDMLAGDEGHKRSRDLQAIGMV
jgi:hypothetical protein